MSRGEKEADLWAMAAELERHFAGYKRRLALAVDADADACASKGGHAAEEEGGGDVRGRMYEAYRRRRDETRPRSGSGSGSGWRARMERKEAQVMALWAQLHGDPSTDDHGGTAPGEQEAEEDGDGEKRRSSDVAAPGRVSGKKHARATARRSLSSTSLKSIDAVRIRRALSQEAPTTSKNNSHRGRAVTGVVVPRRKPSSSSGSNKGSAKEHGGSLRAPAAVKPPRCSSRGLEGIARDREEAAPMPMPMQSAHVDLGHDGDDDQKASSSPEPADGSGNGTGTENAGSPEEVRGEGTSTCASAVVDGGEAEAEPPGTVEADVEKLRDAAAAEEMRTAQRSPEAKLGNDGETMITSDSETEPSYVFIKKKAAAVVVEDEEAIVAMRLSEALAVSEPDAVVLPHLELEVHGGNNGMASAAPTAAADMAPDTPPSCSSSGERRARSIERLLEADAALLRRKREEPESAAAIAGKSVDPATTTPGSAGSRQASGASPRGTSMGFKKRFLNFGKKNSRGNREASSAGGIDCTSPSTPVTPSPGDDGTGGGRWQVAASEETDHGTYAASPQACSLQSLVAASPAKSELGDIVPQEKSPRAHRSFFSLRSFNCSRS